MNSNISLAIELARLNKWSTQDLYTHWWSGTPTAGRRVKLVRELHRPIEVKRILIDSQSNLFSTLTELVFAEVGEFIHLDENRSRIIRKSSWSTEWWNWLQTRRPKSYPAKKLIRIYIPSTSQDLNLIAKNIHSKFEIENVSITLKFRRQYGEFSDAIVVWVEEDFILEAVNIILQQLSEGILLNSPPPLTLNFHGIGISDQLQTGESLGWLFSQFVWMAANSKSDFDLQSKFRVREIDFDQPWLIGRKKSGGNWDSLLWT